jgi:predicted DNA-binding WGR domain protein
MQRVYDPITDTLKPLQQDIDMLAETTIELEARNPMANRLRKWKVELSQDLLGMWTVDIEYGRIGSSGRQLRHVFASQPAAQAFMGRGLRRRSTAPARIGVAYRCLRASVEARELLDKVGIDASVAAHC